MLRNFMTISPCEFAFGAVLPLIPVLLCDECGHPYAKDRLCFGNEVFRIEHLANLGFAFPSRPVLLVKFHEALRAFDSLFFRLQVKLRIPADDFLGFRERPVNDGDLPSLEPDAGALSRGTESPAADHRA